MDLVILAAGMGSRYGGLKQIEPIDDNKDYIIDYSIFDAIQFDFDNVIFVIKKENEQIFKKTIGDRIKTKVNVKYVFQDVSSISDARIPMARTKPLGTAHAILCCRDVVNSPFLIINADDFYGRRSYELASEFIKFTCDDSNFGCIAYDAGKTITSVGPVKRGICEVNEGVVTRIIESSVFCNHSGEIVAKPIDGSEEFVIENSTPVSMNMFIFTPYIFSILDVEYSKFVSSIQDPYNDEFLLPNVISKIICEKNINLHLIKTDETWYGVTYRGDTQYIKGAISLMLEEKKYPDVLWN